MSKTTELTQNNVCEPSSRVDDVVSAVVISFGLNSDESYVDTAACVSGGSVGDVNVTPRYRCCCSVMKALLLPSVIVV